MESSLSAHQWQILVALAGLEPPWALTGGGALAGFHLGHRPTRDLDLFYHTLRNLPDIRPIIERLTMSGFDVVALRTGLGFAQLRVSKGAEVTVVDLVADPVPVVEAPQAVQIDGTEIFVDTPYEILINKLCALLSRAEFRDLVDLEALIAKGLDWKGALRRAEEKDGGFSSATLGWVLNDMPVRALGRAAGADANAIERSTSFRDTLVHELASINRPSK